MPNRPMPRETLLISPNGMAIIDAILRTESEHSSFRSTLSFAQRFKLNQPKLSFFLKALQCKSISQAPAALRALPLEWWLKAMDHPLTRKRQTIYDTAAKTYASPLNEALVLEKLSTIKNCMPAALEHAKQRGLIRDKVIYLWCEEAALKDCKRELQLIPSSTSGAAPTSTDTVIRIASPHYGLSKEAITSAVNPKELNSLRAIWDLSQSDERARSVRADLLTEALKL